MRDPLSQRERLKHERGEGLGYVFGGCMALLLGGFYFLGGSGDFYLLGDISYAQRPMLFIVAMGLLTIFGIGSIFYGIRTVRRVKREYANLEPLHEADLAASKPYPLVMRLGIGILAMLAIATLFTPISVMFGRPAIVTLTIAGLIMMTTGLFTRAYVLAGMGFGMKIAAGLGLWLMTNLVVCAM